MNNNHIFVPKSNASEERLAVFRTINAWSEKIDLCIQANQAFDVAVKVYVEAPNHLNQLRMDNQRIHLAAAHEAVGVAREEYREQIESTGLLKDVDFNSFDVVCEMDFEIVAEYIDASVDCGHVISENGTESTEYEFASSRLKLAREKIDVEELRCGQKCENEGGFSYKLEHGLAAASRDQLMRRLLGCSPALFAMEGKQS